MAERARARAVGASSAEIRRRSPETVYETGYVNVEMALEKVSGVVGVEVEVSGSWEWNWEVKGEEGSLAREGSITSGGFSEEASDMW